MEEPVGTDIGTIDRKHTRVGCYKPLNFYFLSNVFSEMVRFLTVFCMPLSLTVLVVASVVSNSQSRLHPYRCQACKYHFSLEGCKCFTVRV